MRSVLPELDMQVGAEDVLKYFLVRIGMFRRTSGHNWQALIAQDPIIALQNLLLALEWREAATLKLEDPSDQDPLLTVLDPLLVN